MKKSQKFQNIHNKIIQRQLEMRMIKKIPKEIPKERYISPEERQKVIDNLKFIVIV